MKDKNLLRLIDVNFNRLKEALKICEDIMRFYYKEEKIFKKIKNLRNKVNLIFKKDFSLEELLKNRDINSDIGKDILEKKRKNLKEILIANFQRAKESARSLEEFVKVRSDSLSKEFKKIRFKIYDLEKCAILLFSKDSFKK